MQSETGTRGATPEQTVSRELQQLRNEGLLIFGGGGVYSLARHGGTEPDLKAAILTQVEQRILARRGQTRFRNGLLAQWGHRCPLTCISDTELLRASHIIAWTACRNERDRLEPENGLLLSALWDAAFDRGLVSFGPEGEALAYPGLSAAAGTALNLSGVPRLGRLSAGNRARLAVHRHWCETRTWPTTAFSAA